MQVSPERALPGVRDLEDLVAGNNVYIAGPTGSGKSVLSNHVVSGVDGVVLAFDPEEEPIDGFRHIRRPQELRRAVNNGETRILYTPPPSVAQMRADAVTLHDIAFELGERLRGGKAKVDHWFTFKWAEAQLYAAKGDEDGPVPDAQRRGRKRGIRNVVDNQEPAIVSHTVLKQSRVKFLFRFDPIEMEYFRRYSVPIDEMSAHLEVQHNFAMVVGSNWVPYEKLPFDG